MAATRITITVDEDVLDELKSRVGPGEVSAYVVDALRARLRKDPILELLDKLVIHDSIQEKVSIINGQIPVIQIIGKSIETFI